MSTPQLEANLFNLALADWVSLEGWRNSRKEERNYREWLARGYLSVTRMGIGGEQELEGKAFSLLLGRGQGPRPAASLPLNPSHRHNRST
jgi:hypothetical protein